jgi:hypothetical protein
MSPTNRSLDFEYEDVVEMYEQEEDRTPTHQVPHTPMNRSKRIRSGPRRNGHNGMQRRRNKRVMW